MTSVGHNEAGSTLWHSWLVLVYLATGCAPAPTVPDVWEQKYRGRADCVGSSGTECFQYFALAHGDPHRVCGAESEYPANMRRSECFQTFRVADGAHLDPGHLEAASLARGPDQLDALGTLAFQSSRGDPPSRAALHRLVLEHEALPRRAELLSWFAERGDLDALTVLVRRALDPDNPDARDWLPYLARLRGATVGTYLLDAIASPNTELSRQAMNYAQFRPDVPRAEYWRAALSVARRANPMECRVRLQEHLETQPRETLRALAQLVTDAEVGAIAAGVLAVVLEGSRDFSETISDSRLYEVSFWAKAGRKPAYLPLVENEAEVLAAGSAGETEAFESTRLTSRVAFDPANPRRIYVGLYGDQRRHDRRLLAEIRDPAGHSRWLIAEPQGIGGQDYCEPLPGKCHFPSWLPEGSYLVFSDGRPGSLFPVSGTYELTVESPLRAFHHGPIKFETSRR